MRDKIRILHVVSRMKLGGGLPGWLFETMRHMDMDQYQIDFLSILDDTKYDEEQLLASYGSRIYHCAAAGSRILSLKTFRELECIMRGRYDVVNHHLPFYEHPLVVAKLCSIPVRICHVHTDARNALKYARTGILGRSLRYYKRFMAVHCSTHRVGVSRCAGRSFFGENWPSEPTDRLLYCGIDFSPFMMKEERGKIRQDLGLPEDCFVVGHVGRISIGNKNSGFVLEVFSEVVKRSHQAILLWVGGGEDAEDIHKMAASLGVQKNIIFTGIRNDVARLMRVMDAFLFPSRSEGLGLVLVEAQASGIPCVCYDVIPEEADVIPEISFRMSSREPASRWADKLLEIKEAKQILSREDALRRVMASSFNIEHSMEKLIRFYEEVVAE